MRANGRVYEAVAARLAGRPRAALYHSALEVDVDGTRTTIEMTPVHDRHGERRGVVGTGAVGSSRAGRWRIFRYEIRRWAGGTIPDVAEAVASPRRLSQDADLARRLLALAEEVPTPVWGRDELATGDMWNSNSVISWLLERSGLDAKAVSPPPGGRAPGWQAGITVARRDHAG